MPPWQAIGEVVRQWKLLAPGSWQQARVLVDVIPVGLLLVGLVAGARTRPLAFTLYLAGILELCLLAPIVGAQFPDPLAGGGRFVLAAIPLWLDVGRWSVRWLWVGHAVVTVGFMLQAVLCVFVLTGGWLI